MKAHTLVVFSGTLTPALDEEWTCTLRVLGGEVGDALAPIPVGDLNAYLAQVGPNLSSWFANGLNQIPSTVKLTEVKANNIGADGKYVELVTHYLPYGTPVAGGGAAAPGLDIINSIVYSWRNTSRTRGPASKGRMYPPNFAIPHSVGTGRITASNRSAALTSAANLLNVFRNVGGSIHAAPVLISTTNDDWAFINRIQCDDIIDVQRRRKNQLVPAIGSVNWP